MFVSMPQVAVNENREPISANHKVGTPRNIACMEAVPHTTGVEALP